MRATPLAIPDVYLIEPQVFGDDRGFFFESFNQAKFEMAIGQSVNFVQDNHSRSLKGVLRGLHFQTSKSQGKLVRVTQGEVFDVAVDLREGSPSYGRWVAEVLSAENKRQMWIPEGFAHGMQTLVEDCELIYLHTAVYYPEAKGALNVLDPRINIIWPLPVKNLSEQDRAHPFINQDYQGVFP